MEVQRGMVVAGPNGRIGVVQDVVYDKANNASSVIVQRDDGQPMMLHPGSYEVDGGTLRLGQINTSSGMATRPLPTATETTRATRNGASGAVAQQTGDQIVVPVIEEQLSVGTRVVEGGGVRVHKRVEEHEETVEQPVMREEVTVERVPIGQVVDTIPEARQEGDTLIIPVVEEMLVVHKQMVVKEEIRVHKRRVQESEQARVVLRAEKAEIEQLPAASPPEGPGREG